MRRTGWRHSARCCRWACSCCSVSVGAPANFNAAIEQIIAQRAQAVVVHADPVFSAQRGKLPTSCARHGCPSPSVCRKIRPAGGLISLRAERARQLSLCRQIRGQDPEGRQAGRSAGRAADPVRAGHQPEDGPGAGADDPAVAAAARRRGDPASARCPRHGLACNGWRIPPYSGTGNRRSPAVGFQHRRSELAAAISAA